MAEENEKEENIREGIYIVLPRRKKEGKYLEKINIFFCNRKENGGGKYSKF